MHDHHHRTWRIRSTTLTTGLGLVLVTGVLAAPAIAVAAPSGPATSAVSADDELGPELIPTTSFDEGFAPWWTTPDVAAELRDGALCVDAPGGTPNAWSTIVGIDDIPLVKGESYRFSFTISGTAPVTIRALAQMNREPWTSTYELNPTTQPERATIAGGFTSTLDWPEGQLVFQIGGGEEDWTFCLDDVSFRSGPPPEPYVGETHSRVRVNQHGYLTAGPKRATVLVDDPEAAGVEWALRDADDEVVATGTAEPFGFDRTVGSAVQRIVFDDVRATAEWFTLEVDDQVSYPFAIRDELYRPLVGDALHYFYLARSGIELTEEFAGEGYARPAGHLGVAPNQGDLEVRCQAPQGYYQGWTCDSTFDVHGGWYDAGDHGRYVVNGGIAVHQVLDAWEVARRAGATDLVDDGALSIPEAGNGVPDVLDEARWELDWMLRMQVPAGEQYAGMVFHKVQDDGWTGIPMMPWLDEKPRQVHRPSTAATLNFAAVTAKGARLFREFDAAYADELLAASRVAWAAALDTPDLYASVADGDDGGGPYDDTELDDEFYWAAAELYLATGEQEFADFLAESPEATTDVDPGGGFDWRETTALGRIDLAMVESDFAGREAARASLVSAADTYLKAAQSAFEHPYRPTSGEYDWGSNAIILNNQVILAVAAEISGEQKYAEAVIVAMDYLLGRNGNDISYITGYGSTFAQNQHHRWMAQSLDASLPRVATGTISGGPNSAIQDPVAQQAWPDGCIAQLCYLDDIKSWSTNEMTVNWNSALSWVSVWVAAREASGGAQGEVIPTWAAVAGGVAGVGVIAAAGVLIIRRFRNPAPPRPE